ncbi:MAG: MFS transporter [Chloroflexi bacterium]|nr:MAG: MFS transporter [Chloroflexota bacterium]
MSSTVPQTEGAQATSEKKPRLQTFRALRYRNFRLLWISLIVSSVGTWMQIVAQSLLVLQITHGSALALGIVALAQASSYVPCLPALHSDSDRHYPGMDDCPARLLLRHRFEL